MESSRRAGWLIVRRCRDLGNMTTQPLIVCFSQAQGLRNDDGRRARSYALTIQRLGVSKSLGSEISFVGAGLAHAHHVRSQL
jgi:hypothetical protein